MTVVIYGKALPEGHEYKTRTVLVAEESPGPDEITQTRKLYVGEEKISSAARTPIRPYRQSDDAAIEPRTPKAAALARLS